MTSSEIEQRAARVKLLLMDCDGVLTDGRIWLLESGEDQKAFHTRDGLGIELLHRAGLRSGIISGRTSTAVERRARGLGMSFICQGCADKQQAFTETLTQAELTNAEVAFVGDDLNDIPLLLQSGLAVAVADAAPETREHAHYTTSAPGGRGAIREVVELILKSQNRWSDLVRHYL
ncbi:MAG TPA: HAD hydrolase family protein [Pyrinomonadaceae bacterium]|nr:HAD hydrolase family protein [Pyrinomonadaceae bacterium]